MYCIAQFVNNEISIVLSKWLQVVDGNLKALWPPYQDRYKYTRALRLNSDPLPSWKSFSVEKILYKADDLDDAEAHLKMALATSASESTSGLEEGCSSQVNRPQKRRLESRHTSTAKKQKPTKTLCLKKNTSLPAIPLPFRSSVHDDKHFDDDSVGSSTDVPLLSGESAISSSDEQPRRNRTLLSDASDHALGEENDPAAYVDGASFVCEKIDAATQTNDLFNANGNLISMHFQRVYTKLEFLGMQQTNMHSLLQESLKRLDVFPSNPELPPGIDLPLDSMEAVDDIEHLVKEEKNFKALVSCLGSVGGHNASSCTRRIMAQLLSNELAVRFNMRGKGSKRSFGSLQLNKVVQKAVRKNYVTAHATDDEVDTAIKQWLKYASDRNGGRRKR